MFDCRKGNLSHCLWKLGTKCCCPNMVVQKWSWRKIMNSISLENLTYLPSWSHESSAVTNSRQHSNILVKMGEHHDLGRHSLLLLKVWENMLRMWYICGVKRHVNGNCYTKCCKLTLNLGFTCFWCLEYNFVFVSLLKLHLKSSFSMEFFPPHLCGS